MRKTPITAAGIAALIASACQADDFAPGGSDADDSSSVAADTFVTEQATFSLERVAGPLDSPWGMAFLPDGDILVTEIDGQLRLIEDGELMSDPIIGVPDVRASGQGGLLDVALDPEFAENNLIYLSYAAIDEGRSATTRVARGTLVEDSGNPRLPGPILEDVEVIFSSNSLTAASKHYGSRLGFDPDGFLYITLGDRGTPDQAQDLEQHAGSVVRINTDGSVPDDNPFVDESGVLPEIFSYGHRNPQGLAVHPETGRVWTNEHGPRGGDEVNLIETGVNYGWPMITWGINYDGSPINGGLREQEGMAQPQYYWDPSIAPSGMTFYQGDAFPEWQGDLFVGALKYQLITRLEMDGDEIVAEERLIEGEIGRIRDVRTGPDGLLYILTDDPEGGLYRLQPPGD